MRVSDRGVGIRAETARVVPTRATTDEIVTAAWVAQGLQPLLFGLAATSVTAAGHLVAGGGLPAIVVLAALLVAATTWRAALPVGPRSLPATAMSMLAAQGLGHLALGMSHPSDLSGVGHHQEPGGLSVALVDAPESDGLLAGPVSSLLPSNWLAQAPELAMIGMHIGAGVLLAVWLHRGEARTFALIARLRAQFTRQVPCAVVPILFVRATSSALAQIFSMRPILVVHDAPRRGPPHRTVIAEGQRPSHRSPSQPRLQTGACHSDMSSCHAASDAVTLTSRSARVALARSCHRTPLPDRVKLGVCCHGVPSCCSCVCTGRHTHARGWGPDRASRAGAGRAWVSGIPTTQGVTDGG